MALIFNDFLPYLKLSLLLGIDIFQDFEYNAPIHYMTKSSKHQLLWAVIPQTVICDLIELNITGAFA